MKLAIFINEKLRKLLVILILINNSSVISQYYTGSNIPFGQNRVQYNNFFWQSFEFQRSKVYFSKGEDYQVKLKHLTIHFKQRLVKEVLHFPEDKNKEFP